MTVDQMLTKFESMVDDSINQDYALQLLNDAKNEIEGSHDWEKLKKEHTFTTTAGGTVDTEYSLPTDLAFPIALYDDGHIVYSLIPFEEKRRRRDQAFSYFIDYASDKLHITAGTGSAVTMYLYYIGYTDALTTGQTWAFPERFHQLIPCKMAEIYYFSDAGERARSWDDKWAIQYERIMMQMMKWDSKLKIRARRSETFNNYNPKAITEYGGRY